MIHFDYCVKREKSKGLLQRFIFQPPFTERRILRLQDRCISFLLSDTMEEGNKKNYGASAGGKTLKLGEIDGCG